MRKTDRSAKWAGSRRSAFTIVELMVVIGIILILSGLLIGAVGMARTYARNARCAANLKQWGVAANSHATTHNGELPLVGWADKPLYDVGGAPALLADYSMPTKMAYSPALLKGDSDDWLTADFTAYGSANYGDSAAMVVDDNVTVYTPPFPAPAYADNDAATSTGSFTPDNTPGTPFD